MYRKEKKNNGSKKKRKYQDIPKNNNSALDFRDRIRLRKKNIKGRVFLLGKRHGVRAKGWRHTTSLFYKGRMVNKGIPSAQNLTGLSFVEQLAKALITVLTRTLYTNESRHSN